jgi:serpin B
MRHMVLLGMVLVACGGGVARGDDGGNTAVNSTELNQFGADLYRQIAAQSGNLLCSPASVYSALAMIAEGARGDTAAEMRKVLGAYDKNGAGIMAALERPVGDFELHVANAIWAQNGFACLPEYQAKLVRDYKCGYFNVDFMYPAVAGRSINDWVSKETSGKIGELFPPGSLQRSAKLVLTNAIYFHADWRTQFSPGRTGPGDFHVEGSADVQQRPMMREHEEFPFMHGDRFDALELPYKGGQIGMFILLPHAVDGVNDLETKFSRKVLQDVVDGVKPEFAEVTIPKFTFDSGVDLPTALKAIGIQRAFETSADFSGIDGRADLYLSDVKHKAFVAVDEQGTTAAAATGGVMMPTAIAVPKVVFTADHPFLFLIVDHRSGAALFVGRVEDPGSQDHGAK